jgi:hypothetical protein
LGDVVPHIRLSRIAADPTALDDCVAYIKREARQAVEFRPGSLGISVLADRAEGAALFGSVWASSEAMSASERRRDHQERIPRRGGQRYARIP